MNASNNDYWVPLSNLFLQFSNLFLVWRIPWDSVALGFFKMP